MAQERHLIVGSGINTRTEVDSRIQYVATDINEDLLQKLRETGWDGSSVVADAQALPFASETFDSVACHHVLEHIPDSKAALHEISRVTRPGGRIELAVPHPFFEMAMAKVLDGYYPYWSPENHVAVISPQRLREMAEEAGITVTDIERRGWFRAIKTIDNYATARSNEEPINGHTVRISSPRQQRLLAEKPAFLYTVEVMDSRYPNGNKIIPYETVLYGRK